MSVTFESSRKKERAMLHCRWYQAFECRGKREIVINQLSRAIRNHNLGKYLPIARVEKGRSKRFYLFLEVKSSVLGQLPPEVEPIMQLRFLQSPLPGVLALQDIKKMSRVGAEARILDYVIPYRHPPILSQEDDHLQVIEGEFEQTTNETDFLKRMQAYDRLLFWLSAKGQGSWNLFRGACQALGLAENGPSTGSIARCLRLLGHLEFSADGKKWSIAPTVLIKSDFQEAGDQYILCGQRNTRLLQQLRTQASIEEEPQATANGPATIRLWSHNVKKWLKTLSSHNVHIHHGGRVAYQLAQFLPSSGEWMRTLESLKIRPHRYYLKRFTGKSFENVAFDKQSGLYQLFDKPKERDKPYARPKYTLFYHATKKHWLRGDWYGLRFLALQADDTRCPVYYDQATRRLAILHDWRWPELYERVLVLASGRLPKRNGNRGEWLFYDGISPQTVDQLRFKLNLKIEELTNA